MKSSEEDILVIPGKEYCLRVKNQYISEGRAEGIDEGRIGVYYEDMKMSSADIAKKMNKPLDMVLKVIQKLNNSNS